jgi:1,4-alpha-glucan branching enzyme
MITKAYSKDGKSCKVTFEIDPPTAESLSAKTVHLAGDFNGWNFHDSRMTKKKTGGFSTTIKLDRGRSYKFRYVVNETEWVNDGAADGYVSNDVGSEDSIINV